MVATRIGTIERLFCAAPSYLAENGVPQLPEDLRHHSCLHYSLLSVREEWGAAFGRTGEMIDIKGALSANNAEVLKEGAIQAMGITLLPRFVVDDALIDARLRSLASDFARLQPAPFRAVRCPALAPIYARQVAPVGRVPARIIGRQEVVNE